MDTPFPNQEGADQTEEEVDTGAARFTSPSEHSDGVHPGQDPLLLSRDSHVIPLEEEKQPADKNANMRLRDIEMLPNDSKNYVSSRTRSKIRCNYNAKVIKAAGKALTAYGCNVEVALVGDLEVLSLNTKEHLQASMNRDPLSYL